MKSDEYRDNTIDRFSKFVKGRIKDRSYSASLGKIRRVVECCKNNVKNNIDKISGDKQLDTIILINEYYSHIGSMSCPYSKEEFLSVLKASEDTSETRLLRKWEKYVSFCLRKAQIDFNGYNFKDVVECFEQIWEGQEKIIGFIAGLFGLKKDEPTTAIIGTLAQAYAYNGNYEEAIEHFNLSVEYAIKSSAQTASYLLTLYHRCGDVENVRIQFERQVGEKPEEYYMRENFKNNWELLSYCKIRALELYKGSGTKLPHIELEKLKSWGTEYPFSLVLKWEGISLFLEDAERNRDRIGRYFSEAISSLLKDDNGFAIKALSLPIILCYGVVDNQNDFHSRYMGILRDLKSQSEDFRSYVDTRAPMLNEMKNDADIWERALALPFTYS